MYKGNGFFKKGLGLKDLIGRAIKSIEWDGETYIFPEITEIISNGYLPVVHYVGDGWGEYYFPSYLDDSDYYFATLDEWGNDYGLEFWEVSPDTDFSDKTNWMCEYTIYKTGYFNNYKTEWNGYNSSNGYVGNLLGSFAVSLVYWDHNNSDGSERLPTKEFAVPYPISYHSYQSVDLATILGGSRSTSMIWRQVAFNRDIDVVAISIVDRNLNYDLSQMRGIYRVNSGDELNLFNLATEWTVENQQGAKILNMDDVYATNQIVKTGVSGGMYLHTFRFRYVVNFSSNASYLIPSIASRDNHEGNGPNLTIYKNAAPVQPWNNIWSDEANEGVPALCGYDIKAPLLKIQDTDGNWYWI